MILKIEKVSGQDVTVFLLSGRMREDHLPELQNLLNAEPDMNKVVLDLSEVRLVEREAMKFLAACEARGAQLQSCPGYLREWMQKEKQSPYNGQGT